MKDLKENSYLFPLRLLLLYVLSVGVLPTIDFWLDFGDMEATEEGWDTILVFSVIVSVPLVAASWAGIRNLKRLPILAVLLTLFTAFHLCTTGLLCADGFLGEPYSDSGLSAYAFERYAETFAIFAMPFIAIYIAWRFWPQRRNGLTVS